MRSNRFDGSHWAKIVTIASMAHYLAIHSVEPTLVGLKKESSA